MDILPQEGEDEIDHGLEVMLEGHFPRRVGDARVKGGEGVLEALRDSP